MPDPFTIIGLSYVGKKSADVVAEFVRDALGPSFKAAGEGIAAPLQAWKERRVQRANQTVMEVAEALERAGKTVQEVPPRVLWPLIEKASLEEDPELHGLWKSLLFTAADAAAPEVPPAFVDILAGLTPKEARVLQRVFDRYHSERWGLNGDTNVHLSIIYHEMHLEHSEYGVITSNLIRLQLVSEPPPVIRAHDLMKTMAEISRDRYAIRDLETQESRMRDHKLTDLGAAFLKAVMTPRAGGSEPSKA